jgi:hypothetical protein
MLDRGSSMRSDPLFCQILGGVENTRPHMTSDFADIRRSAASRHPSARLCQ